MVKLLLEIQDKTYQRIKSDNGHGYHTLRDDDMHEVVNGIITSDIVYPKSSFDIIHYCTECKHRTSDIREQPCLHCNVRKLKDNWEAEDESRK